MRNFALKGNIIFTPQKNELRTFPDSYVICSQNTCEGVYPELPDEYKHIRVIDFGDALIIPGMVDLHIHVPQYAFRGTGMDCELLDWLKLYAFPEEAKYSDTDYAARAYGIFADNMKRSATTRAVIFGTVHREATLLLMDLMEAAGIVSYVGKVNMDRDAPDELRESCADASAFDTFGFINAAEKRHYRLTMPILTPRFIPSCSNALLNELQRFSVLMTCLFSLTCRKTPEKLNSSKNSCLKQNFTVTATTVTAFSEGRQKQSWLTAYTQQTQK